MPALPSGAVDIPASRTWQHSHLSVRSVPRCALPFCFRLLGLARTRRRSPGATRMTTTPRSSLARRHPPPTSAFSRITWVRAGLSLLSDARSRHHRLLLESELGRRRAGGQSGGHRCPRARASRGYRIELTAQNTGNDPYTDTQLANAFSAAASVGGIKLALSFDFVRPSLRPSD